MDINELLEKQKDLSNNIEQNIDNEGEARVEVNIIQLVSFILDDVEYGVDILSVHEILRIQNITRLPNTPDFIKGVINLRGNVFPIVDIRKRFGFPSVEYTDLTRIIVVETMGKLIGLLIDKISQVVRIPENNVDLPSDLIEGVSEEFIRGIGRLRDRLIIILNINNILFQDGEDDTIV